MLLWKWGINSRLYPATPRVMMMVLMMMMIIMMMLLLVSRAIYIERQGGVRMCTDTINISRISPSG
jgi:hypothetical protein